MKRLSRSLSAVFAWVIEPVLVVVILVVGFYAASQLSMRREPPARDETVVYSPLVRTQTARRTDHQVVVLGNGALSARTRVDLVPQVGGRIVDIHPALRAGGQFAEGDVLARIEKLDYELAVTRAEAEVSSAETELATLRAESEAAIEEWNRLRPGEDVPDLVGLEPQLRENQARIVAARSQLESARLDLARTEITLPFDGRVVSVTADVGQVVNANQAIGVVYSTDVFEVAVPLRTEELSWLDLPSPPERVEGSLAVVRGAGAGGPIEVEGRVMRVLGELDAASRMARVVVEVSTEGLEGQTLSRLLPGAFVDVELAGRSVVDVTEVPRSALREDGVVWVVEEGRLRFARPELIRSSKGSVFVGGLEDGAQVVTSNLEVVTDGMEVRLQGADAGAEAPSDAQDATGEQR